VQLSWRQLPVMLDKNRVGEARGLGNRIIVKYGHIYAVISGYKTEFSSQRRCPRDIL